MSSRTCVTGRAGDHGVEHAGHRLRAQAEQARLVLVDADADLARRLDPVEIDRLGIGAAGHDLGQVERDRAHLRGSGPLTRYCTGQPTGGPSSSGETRATTLGNCSASAFSSLALQPLAGRDVLGDDHRLGEEVVGELDVERQVEADGTAADIGAPARDVRVTLAVSLPTMVVGFTRYSRDRTFAVIGQN